MNALTTIRSGNCKKVITFLLDYRSNASCLLPAFCGELLKIKSFKALHNKFLLNTLINLTCQKTFRAMNTSVHDQLDDLTELLKTALSDENKHSEMVYDIVDTKNPGKINQKLINNLQHKMEESARQVRDNARVNRTEIVKRFYYSRRKYTVCF